MGSGILKGFDEKQYMNCETWRFFLEILLGDIEY